jgi:hypothetical protein
VVTVKKVQTPTLSAKATIYWRNGSKESLAE